jgi:sn-glycerol 3-phosphate transport system substrate-binding protein
VLLSTDMFTLIDEDAIVPIDNFVKTADDKKPGSAASTRPSC